MKKIIIFLLAIVFCASLSAFSFSFAPVSSFYENLNSSLFNPGTYLKISYNLKADPQEDLIRADEHNDVPGEYYLDFKDYKQKDDLLILLQGGGGISGFNFAWDGYFEIQGRFEAYIKTVLFFLNGNDCIGFDGSYFGGFEMKILDSVIIRGGARHFSGHIGDEVLHDMFKRHSDCVYTELSQYVRDNYELSVGYCSEAFPYVKGAVAFMMPQKKSYMDPFVHRPDDIVSGGKTNAERNPEAYAIRGDYGKDYHAITLAGELTFAFPFAGNSAYLSLEGKLHQDGWTNHTLDPSDDTKNWEYEYDATLGIERRNKNNRSITFEVTWHSGRFPLLNFYWKRVNSFTVGFTVR